MSKPKFSYKGYLADLDAAKARGATPDELDALRAKWSGEVQKAALKQSVALPERPAAPEPVPLKAKPPRKERSGDRF